MKEVTRNPHAVIAMLERVTEEESQRDILTNASRLLTIVFNDILHTINILNKTLQGNDVDLREAYLLNNACLENLRAMLEAFSEAAKELGPKADAEAEFKNKRSQGRKRNLDEMSSDEVATDLKQLCKTWVFFYSLVMIEQQSVDLFCNHQGY